MPKILLSEIDPREQKQIATAENEIRKGNAAFAVETCRAVLGRHPECTEIRRILRKAQKVATGKRPASAGMLSKLFGPSKSSCEKNPQKALSDAENALSKNPYDVNANKMLAFAGAALEMWDVVALAYEELVACDSNTENYSALVSAYLKDKDVANALKAVDSALKRFPNNGDLQELARQVSVAQTMDKGKWSGEGDFRDNIADKDKALALEKKNRVVSDAESAAEEIPGILEKIEKTPEDLQLYRDLARNYRLTGDLDSAIAAIQKARETPNGKVDATLEKQEHSLTLENYDKRIREAKNFLAENPENEEYKNYLAELEKSLDEYSLQAIQTLVEKYPNDYNYRYEYGLRLLDAGDIDGSIQQLQLAQRAPKNRHLAMLNLGRAFISGEKYDLAAAQLSTARDEIKQMSDIKKDIIYELAIAYEKAGKTDLAATEYKAIYMADASYKDVAEKINSLYEKK